MSETVRDRLGAWLSTVELNYIEDDSILDAHVIPGANAVVTKEGLEAGRKALMAWCDEGEDEGSSDVEGVVRILEAAGIACSQSEEGTMGKLTWGEFKMWVEGCGVGDDAFLDSIHSDTTHKDEARMTLIMTTYPDVDKPTCVDIYINVEEENDE
jgi:hypothetical protein